MCLCESVRREKREEYVYSVAGCGIRECEGELIYFYEGELCEGNNHWRMKWGEGGTMWGGDRHARGKGRQSGVLCESVRLGGRHARKKQTKGHCGAPAARRTVNTAQSSLPFVTLTTPLP